MNVFLIGYRGTGKTTVAELIAAELHSKWVDTDVVVEQRAGLTIAEIFSKHGEPWFRQLETRVLRDLIQEDQYIFALGGGIVLQDKNRAMIEGKGMVVWLKAFAETIANRIDQDSSSISKRPNLTKSGGFTEIHQLLKQRIPTYRACADYEVDTEGKTPEQVAREIVDQIQSKRSISRGT